MLTFRPHCSNAQLGGDLVPYTRGGSAEANSIGGLNFGGGSSDLNERRHLVYGDDNKLVRGGGGLLVTNSGAKLEWSSQILLPSLILLLLSKSVF